MGNTNLVIIFLTGLTTGGLSCLAIQGGLLATIIAGPKTDSKTKNSDAVLPVLMFLVAKLVSYTILGTLLGLLGSLVSLTPQFRGILQVFIGFYLVGVALALLDVHPFFRRFIITPPKALARFVKDESKSQSVFAPLILGLSTVLLPCATTQAMEILALGTGNPLYGALIMFAFVLGTSPTFFILGFVVSKLSGVLQGWFYRLTALFLIFMAIFSINTGMSVMGSVYTLQNFAKAAITSDDQLSGQTGGQVEGVKITNGVQEATINVLNGGYNPQEITLKQGVPVKLTLVTNNTQSCSRAFTIPKLGIQKVLPVSGQEIVEFTPTQTGNLVYSCSMGMYTGVFKIIP